MKVSIALRETTNVYERDTVQVARAALEHLVEDQDPLSCRPNVTTVIIHSWHDWEVFDMDSGKVSPDMVVDGLSSAD